MIKFPWQIHYGKSWEMVYDPQYFYVAKGLSTKFIMDYTFWFFLYPELDKRLPILTHALSMLVVFHRPEFWVVVRNFTGLSVLFLTYNHYCYSRLFNTEKFSMQIKFFAKIYREIYPIILLCFCCAELVLLY